VRGEGGAMNEHDVSKLKILLVFSLILYLGTVSFLGFAMKELNETIKEESRQIVDLKSQLSQLRSELSSLKEKIQNASSELAVSYSKIYERLKDSVVIVQGKIVRQTFFGKDMGTFRVQVSFIITAGQSS